MYQCTEPDLLMMWNSHKLGVSVSHPQTFRGPIFAWIFLGDEIQSFSGTTDTTTKWFSRNLMGMKYSYWSLMNRYQKLTMNLPVLFSLLVFFKNLVSSNSAHPHSWVTSFTTSICASLQHAKERQKGVATPPHLRLKVCHCVMAWSKPLVVCLKSTMWVFPKIGVPQNGWFILKNPIKMDDLGVPLFSETPMFCWGSLSPSFSTVWISWDFCVSLWKEHKSHVVRLSHVRKVTILRAT